MIDTTLYNAVVDVPIDDTNDVTPVMVGLLTEAGAELLRRRLSGPERVTMKPSAVTADELIELIEDATRRKIEQMMR